MSISPKASYSFELLADYVEGFVDQATALRIEEQIKEDEVSREIVEGIRHWFASNGTDREALERYLEDFEKRLSARIQSKSSSQKTAEHNSGQDIAQNSPQNPSNDPNHNPNHKPDKSQERRIESSKSSSQLFLRIAAGLVLIAGGLALAGIFNNKPSPDKLILAALEEQYRAPTTARGGDLQQEEPAAQWAEFKQLWSLQDFKAAAELASTISSPSPEQIFYMALANLYAGEYSQSTNILQQVASMDNEYSEQARWYAAIGMYKMDKVGLASGIFQKIAGEEGHYKQAEAKELIAAIR